MKDTINDLGKILFYTGATTAFILAGNYVTGEIQSHISQIDLEELLYLTLSAAAAGILSYSVQMRTIKDYIKEYKIDKITGINKDDLAINGIESIVSDYSDKDLKQGWPFKTKKNKKKLRNNFIEKENIYPDALF